MDFTRPLLYLLNFICSSTCILAWLLPMVMVTRWNARRTVTELQSRLQTWAAERVSPLVNHRRIFKTISRAQAASSSMSGGTGGLV
jgi:hypothetical protein